MNSENIASNEIAKRQTFAIISHPDAGKTTITERLLLLGHAIQIAGTVKARKSSKHATSDWMQMEQDRGISVTTSVMQFPYSNRIVNLLDTPGHADFSEDTYRTLTAVDSALMIIDGAKGVEDRTIKLMQICRLRNTPTITFINKMDRDIRDPIELLDEIESVLGLEVAPINWPIGMGSQFRGLIHLATETIMIYERVKNSAFPNNEITVAFNSSEARDILGDDWSELSQQVELIKGTMAKFDQKSFLTGQRTPIYFGSAMGNFGVKQMLDDFVTYAPSPLRRKANTRLVKPEETKFSGFIFKIQANMDPKHRDRIAFMRICSGVFRPGMRMYHCRLGKYIRITDALTFLAGNRRSTSFGYPGDILGIYNHGTIQIGDAFSEGESIQFTGIPHFSPELFRRVILKDPLKNKQLQKGLKQLSEEGATQIFMPLGNNNLILGAVGVLQFDVVRYRLLDEYRVDAGYETVNVVTSRWIYCDDNKYLAEFKAKVALNLALDGGGHLTYLVPTYANLSLMKERWPKIDFAETREH